MAVLRLLPNAVPVKTEKAVLDKIGEPHRIDFLPITKVGTMPNALKQL
jgi:hypothetical protein